MACVEKNNHTHKAMYIRNKEVCNKSIDTLQLQNPFIIKNYLNCFNLFRINY